MQRLFEKVHREFEKFCSVISKKVQRVFEKWCRNELAYRCHIVFLTVFAKSLILKAFFIAVF